MGPRLFGRWELRRVQPCAAGSFGGASSWGRGGPLTSLVIIDSLLCAVGTGLGQATRHQLPRHALSTRSACTYGGGLDNRMLSGLLEHPVAAYPRNPPGTLGRFPVCRPVRTIPGTSIDRFHQEPQRTLQDQLRFGRRWSCPRRGRPERRSSGRGHNVFVPAHYSSRMRGLPRPGRVRKMVFWRCSRSSSVVSSAGA